MKTTKSTNRTLATLIIASTLSGVALADVKVRLKSGNNFIVEDRASGDAKFIVNETVGATTGGGTSGDTSHTTTGISAAENAIGDVLDPVQEQDVATKNYVDAAVAVAASGFTFEEVTSATGRVWMDRDLGAQRACTTMKDISCMGDLYQWGRPKDGHESRGGSEKNTTAATTITPGHIEFIVGAIGNNWYDWTLGDDDGSLRESFMSAHDGSGVCPTGFRAPTTAEFTAEVATWAGNGTTGNGYDLGGFNTPLKWGQPGYRHATSLGIDAGQPYITTRGYWWSSEPIGSGASRRAHYMFSDWNFKEMRINVRATAHSIRCIKHI